MGYVITAVLFLIIGALGYAFWKSGAWKKS